MNPDDNFSPPLDGLSRGKKLHQILTTLKSHDKVIAAEQSDEQIASVFQVEEVVDTGREKHTHGVLICDWWHMPREDDWWEYKYLEFIDPGEGSVMDLENGEGIDVDITRYCAWCRQANDDVDGQTYFEEITDEGWERDSFDTDIESPRPLTRAILDKHLIEDIKNRYQE